MSSKSGKQKEGAAAGRAENRLRAQEQVRRRRILFRIVWFLVAPVAAIAIAWFYLSRPMPKPAKPIRLTVPAHSGIMGISHVLQRDGVVRSAYVFAIVAKFGGKGTELKSGHYKFSGELGLEQVIDRLTEGPNDSASDRTRVTIPEGFTVTQIAKSLGERGIVDAALFEKYVTDPDSISNLTAEFPLPKASLEGYLFPDTYDFLPHSTPGQVANQMLMNWQAILPSLSARDHVGAQWASQR